MDALVDLPSADLPEGDELAPWLETRLGVAYAARRLAKERQNEAVTSRSPLRRLFRSHTYVDTMAPIGLRLSGSLARAQRNASRIEVVRHEVIVPHLPSGFDGYTLLHLTDLHADISEAAMAALPAAIRGLDYDVCVITGDFRGRTFGPHERAADLVAGVVSAIPRRTFGILGNHDPAALLPSLERAGIRMLMNERVRLERGRDHVWLAGVDDPHHYHTDDIGRAAAGIDKGEKLILLSHSADNHEQAAQAGVDLFLCGHTHGGQICLPGGRPIVTSTNLPRRFASGAWRHGAMVGYTGRGVGTSVIDARFNCPPEVTLHTLRRA